MKKFVNNEQRDSLTNTHCLAQKELDILLTKWNNTQVAYPKDLCIHELFESQVERRLDSTAVVFKNTRISYQELNKRANQLARHLRKLGVGPEVLVGICMERSIEMIIGVLGIVKAGGAYIPLEPSYPKELLSFMLSDANPLILVVQEKVIESLPHNEAQTVCIDADWDIILQEKPENLPTKTTANNLAYIIYTSGSTGKRKGVMITHSSLVNAYWAWKDAYSLSQNDCHLQVASFSFDVFTGDWVRSLCSGSKLVLNPHNLILSPNKHSTGKKLYNLMRREQITCAEFTPPILRNLIQYVEDTNQTLKFMRVLIVGADAWYMNEHRKLLDLCGSTARVINSYGMTEATVDSTYFEGRIEDISSNGHSSLIGRPFSNTQIYILDQHQQPVPIGEPGEICVSGAGLARGYLNSPTLTQERFVPNPFDNNNNARLYKSGDLGRYKPDGSIEFLGRIDNQVEIRAIRVELGEIEATLQECPSVRENVVIAQEDMPGKKYLIAYIVPDTKSISTPNGLSSFLKERLPHYMIPSVFVMLESLPLTHNGKIDRTKLSKPKEVIQRL